jgi:hypothetical protein
VLVCAFPRLSVCISVCAYDDVTVVLVKPLKPQGEVDFRNGFGTCAWAVMVVPGYSRLAAGSLLPSWWPSGQELDMIQRHLRSSSQTPPPILFPSKSLLLPKTVVIAWAGSDCMLSPWGVRFSSWYLCPGLGSESKTSSAPPAQTWAKRVERNCHPLTRCPDSWAWWCTLVILALGSQRQEHPRL